MISRPTLPFLLLFLLLAAALAGLALTLPPIAQPLQYHDFADQRACGILPNCLDTASNALFVLAGALGLFILRGVARQRPFSDARVAAPYALFFCAVILIGFASGFYHLAPDNARLAWDRAAISLALMAWLAAVVCERVNVKAGLRLLPIGVAAGLGSVLYWSLSEARGSGDLRPYGLMQLFPMLLIPLLLRLYPVHRGGDRDILAVIGLYFLALLFDFSDHRVFDLTGGLVSGHTIKHLVAALAAVWVARYLWRRTL